MKKSVSERLEKALDKIIRYKYDDYGLITEKRVRISDLEKFNFTDDEMDEVFSLLKNDDIFVTGLFPGYYSDYDNYRFVGRQHIIKKCDKLSVFEQLELLKDYRENDNIDSRNKLVMSYSKLVSMIASRYESKYNIEFAELVNCGFMGVIDAIDNYNEDICNMSTYIYKFIHGYILVHIRDYYGYKSVYRDSVLNSIINGLKDENCDKKLNEYEYLDEIINLYLDGSENESKDRIMLNLYYASSLDDIVEDVDAVDNVSLYQDAIQKLYEEQVSNQIDEVLGCLTEKQRQAVRDYYGLGGRDSHTLQEIADERNVCVQSVQTAVKNALIKLEKSHKDVLENIYNEFSHEYDYSSEDCSFVKVARKV